MIDLPNGWAIASIEELAGSEGLVTDGDWIESKDQDPQGNVRLIQLADIGDGEFRDRSSRFVNSTTVERLRCTPLREGDLLIARMPDPLGRACIFPGVGQQAITAVDVFIWRPSSESVVPRWLMHFVNSPEVRGRVAEQAGGTTRQRISGGRLKQLLIPVPPFPEQQRIVAKIDRLFAKSRRAGDNLDHIPRLVEKYKLAVLQAAFRGDLTADWRDKSSFAGNDGPRDLADVKLNDEERGKWSAELLPAGWEWRPFENVFHDVTDGKRKLQQNQYLPSGRFPVVDQGESLIGGYTDEKALVHPLKPPFIVFGDHTRCVKFFDMPFVQGADGVKVLHVAADIEPLFARYALMAVELPDKGYSRHMKFVRATWFPVAPREEQLMIVKQIQIAFTWIERLAAERNSARRLIGHLDQAVLTKAFRGELVPQDPNDEPANVLLERIKQAKEEGQAKANGRGGRGKPRSRTALSST